MLKHFDAATVALMRGDVADLAVEREHALRLVARLSAGLVRLQTSVRRSLDLSDTEYRALISLWDGGRCTMSELAGRISLSRAAMTTVSDALERRELMERRPDPTDRRRILISPTVQFETELWRALEGLEQVLDDVADGDDWQAFGRVASALRTGALAEAERIDAEVANRATATSSRKSTKVDAPELDMSW